MTSSKVTRKQDVPLGVRCPGKPLLAVLDHRNLPLYPGPSNEPQAVAFTGPEIQAFFAGVKDGEFDDLM
jgi:hypothetical protein